MALADLEVSPQGLKPTFCAGLNGTAKAVPFPNLFLKQPLVRAALFFVNGRCSDREVLIFTRELLKNVPQWLVAPIPQLRRAQRSTGNSPQQLTGYILRYFGSVTWEPFPLVVQVRNLCIFEASHLADGPQFTERESFT
jgi:hypothetical protein